MPQDKRRSFSCRSFVTCDDPNGIECGAIKRKSKINAQKREQPTTTSNVKAYSNLVNNNRSISLARSVVKEKIEHNEMVIEEIKRGIETTPVTFQLLEVSKEVDKLNHVIKSWSNGNNNNIAKDLLKGALDLQESLLMLGKLQDASSFMLGIPKKLEEGTFDGMVNGVRGALKGRYGRNNVDRDSRLMQNVMMKNPVFEGQFYDPRNMVSSDMIPSTSSSQSSMVYSSNFVPSDSSILSSATSQSRIGDSNLIVKYMSLESFPSSPSRYTEKERSLNVAKPAYDNDLTRAKRPQFGAQEIGIKQRSEEEILKNLKIKRLLRNYLANGLTLNSQGSEAFSPKNSLVDEKSAIVVKKPISYRCLDLDAPYMPKFWGDNQSNKKAISSEVKGSMNLQPKPLKKLTQVKKAGVLEKVTSTRRKGEEKKDAKSSDCLSSRDPTLKTSRKKDGKPVSKNQTSSQQKMAATTMLDHRTSELKKNRQSGLVVEQKRLCEGEKKEREVIFKADSDLGGDNYSDFPTVSSIIADNDAKQRCQCPITDYDIDNRTKLLGTSEEIPYLPSGKSPHYDDNQSSYSQITSVSTSEFYGTDQLGETAESSHCEVTLVTTHENGIAVHHDTNWEGTESLEKSMSSPRKKDDDSLRQCVSPRMKLKALILSNTACVNHMEEFFNIQANPDVALSVFDDGDKHLESPRLLTDCAKEVLELKSSLLLQSCLPLPLTYTRNPLINPPLDFLLEEVCNGIEDLRCYSRQICDNFPSDNLYVLIDRDFRFKSGIWGVGWRSMYTQDEVEQVLGEVDRLVLNDLIEEALLDFLK